MNIHQTDHVATNHFHSKVVSGDFFRLAEKEPQQRSPQLRGKEMEKAGPGQAQGAPRIGSERVINELAHRVGWG